MNQYDLAEYWWTRECLQFRCTDPFEIDSLLTFLDQFKGPRAKSNHLAFHNNAFGGKCGVDIYWDYLGGYLSSVPKINWTVFKYLCSRGWEPLGSTGDVEGAAAAVNTVTSYLFKRSTAA